MPAYPIAVVRFVGAGTNCETAAPKSEEKVARVKRNILEGRMFE